MAPPDLLRCSFLTAASISSSVGTESSMCVGSTVTGMFSPGDGTRLFSSVRSAVIRSSVAQAGGGPLFAAALYHPFIRRHASLAFGGSSFSNASTANPASSTCRLLSPLQAGLNCCAKSPHPHPSPFIPPHRHPLVH